MMKHQQALEQYLAFWRDLTPAHIQQIHPLITDDVHFADPFQDCRGRANFEKVLHKIFHDCRAIEFQTLDTAWSAQTTNRDDGVEAVVYVRWAYRALPQKSPEWWILHGMSELHLAADGRVMAHLDHWDCASQIFPKIPILRTIWAFIQRKMRAV